MANTRFINKKSVKNRNGTSERTFPIFVTLFLSREKNKTAANIVTESLRKLMEIFLHLIKHIIDICLNSSTMMILIRMVKNTRQLSTSPKKRFEDADSQEK